MDYNTLEKLFQDKDKSVRIFCLKAMIRDKMQHIDSFLIEGLRDGRPDVVTLAMKASEFSSDPEVVGMIITYLESPNTVLQGQALNALSHHNTPQVKDAVCDFLKTAEDTALVATAIQTIGIFKSYEFIPLLKAFLNYADERVRANTVEALAEIDSPEIVDILKLLVGDKNNRVRANAIKALWERGIRFGLNTLPEELRSQNTRKRASVAYILGEIKEERSLDLLVGLLNDISPTVRNRAVLSIGKIGSGRVIGHLADAFMHEEESSIRDNIMKISVKLNTDLAIARFTEKFTREENPRERAVLIRSLALAVEPKAVVLLAKALHDPDGRVRANAVEAIGALSEAQYVDLLFPMLNDSNNRVRSNAAAALWKLGGIGAVITLKQMIQSSHKQMRSSAAWALGEIGALQFSDVLQDLTGDSDPDVRRCALKALAKVSKIT